MITIKFRGRCAFSGVWRYGFYYVSKGNHIIRDENDRESIVLEKTICQFTGKYDKNGKEIYRDDVIKYYTTNKYSEYYTTIVKWGDKSSGFTLKCDTRKYERFGTIKYYSIPSSKYIEVIGNIHENIELLENKLVD